MPRGNSAYIHFQEDETIYVNRTMPFLLEGHLSKEEWKLICDDLDAALVPANKYRRNERIMYYVLNINIVLLVINFVVTELILKLEYSISSNLNNTIVLVHEIFTVLLIIVFLSYVAIWHFVTKHTVEREIRRVVTECAEPKINFCVMQHSKKKKRFISAYIEVTVGNKSIRRADDILVPKFKSDDDSDDSDPMA